LFSEGCFALVEGEYTEEATLEIIAIGQPPCEPRLTARCVFLLLNDGKDFKCVCKVDLWSHRLSRERCHLSPGRCGCFYFQYHLSLICRRLNSKLEYAKKSRSCIFSFSRTSGWITPKRCPEFRRCSIIVSRMISFPK
jgi:hypothetical protein